MEHNVVRVRVLLYACTLVRMYSLTSSLYEQGGITSHSPLSTIVIVIFQYQYNNAKNIFRERGGRKNVRSTLPWRKEDEVKFLKDVNVARNCEVLWIGAASSGHC